MGFNTNIPSVSNSTTAFAEASSSHAENSNSLPCRELAIHHPQMGIIGQISNRDGDNISTKPNILIAERVDDVAKGLDQLSLEEATSENPIETAQGGSNQSILLESLDAFKDRVILASCEELINMSTVIRRAFSANPSEDLLQKREMIYARLVEEESHLSARSSTAVPSQAQPSDSRAGSARKKAVRSARENLLNSGVRRDRPTPTCYQVPLSALDTSGKVEVVTGDVAYVEPCNPTPELINNFEISRRIIHHVQSQIQWVPNYPSRFGERWLPDRKDEAVSKLHDLYRPVYLKRPFLQNDPWEPTVITAWTQAVETFHAGTCLDMSLLGFLWASQDSPRTAELYEIVHGDHAFLVVGRDSSTDPEKPETWNPDAVICDPWANAYYPAFLYHFFLSDWKGRRVEEIPTDDGKSSVFVPRIKPFNPCKQTLRRFGYQY